MHRGPLFIDSGSLLRYSGGKNVLYNIGKADSTMATAAHTEVAAGVTPSFVSSSTRHAGPRT